MATYTMLEDRGVLAVSGPDARAFLQGLVSNDVDRATGQTALWSAFLSAQGKYLYDFMIAVHEDDLLLDCEAARAGEFAKRLSMYRLRSKVTVADVTADWTVAAAFGPGAHDAFGLPAARGAMAPFAGGLAAVDPRLAAMGVRAMLPRSAGDIPLEALGLRPGTREDYDRHRIGLGVPDGSRDMEVDKTVLLEAGFEELAGVDFNKGCYMGQELTARTKFRGLVKRRLLPVAVDGAMPEPGTPVMLGDVEAGQIRSSAGGKAIAMLRLNLLEKSGDGTLTASGATVTPLKPDWARF
jgi:folate-binding protein YgfZ